MKTIILVRHGESETNVSKVFTGQLDTPLTQTGKLQAELSAQFLDKYKIDKIYSSSLSRAVDTAKAISIRQGIDIEKTDAFCETNAGEWQGRTFDEISTLFPDTYSVWKTNIGMAHPEGGESCSMLYSRVNDKFSQIIKNSPHKTICIVTHATPIRMMECFMQNKVVDYAQNISWVPNASVSAYEYDGAFKTILRGNSEHLGNMITNLPKSI